MPLKMRLANDWISITYINGHKALQNLNHCPWIVNTTLPFKGGYEEEEMRSIIDAPNLTWNCTCRCGDPGGYPRLGILSLPIVSLPGPTSKGGATLTPAPHPAL